MICTQYGFIESPVSVPVTWTLEPKGLGSLDAKTGALAVAASARPGTAREGDRRAGGARQAAAPGERDRRHRSGAAAVGGHVARDGPPHLRRNGKAGGPDSTPADEAPLIREFKLNEDGTFAVTWFPFERYKDYWGTYTVDRESGAVTFTVTGGNAVPPRAPTSPAA